MSLPYNHHLWLPPHVSPQVGFILDLIFGAQSTTYVLAAISVVVVLPTLIHVIGSLIHLVAHLFSRRRFVAVMAVAALCVTAVLVGLVYST